MKSTHENCHTIYVTRRYFRRLKNYDYQYRTRRMKLKPARSKHHQSFIHDVIDVTWLRLSGKFVLNFPLGKFVLETSVGVFPKLANVG